MYNVDSIANLSFDAGQKFILENVLKKVTSVSLLSNIH